VYDDWLIAVCEHAVRAAVARLSSDDDETILRREEGDGFLYIRPIAGALRDYEQQRAALS